MKKISSMNRIGLSLVACVARPMMKLSVSIAAALLSAQLASASPYATSLTNNAGTISFRLNESASAVAVIFTNLTGFTVVSILALNPLA